MFCTYLVFRRVLPRYAVVFALAIGIAIAGALGLLRVDAALHAMISANETPLRLMLAHSLEQSVAPREADLPARQNRRSGLTEAIHLLSNIPGIAFRYFTEVDVVRHPLVQQIIKAYDASKSPK